MLCSGRRVLADLILPSATVSRAVHVVGRSLVASRLSQRKKTTSSQSIIVDM